jgi:hypothetical protein
MVRGRIRQGQLARVFSVIVVGLLLSSCADPKETAERGDAELVRHRNSPFLSIGFPTWAPASSTDMPARVDETFLGMKFAEPTSFLRTYSLNGSSAMVVFDSLDAALQKRGANHVRTVCSVSARTETRTYTTKSFDDDVSIRVFIDPKLPAPLFYELLIQGTPPGPSVGLRNCREVVLDPSAFVAAFALNRPAAELCSLVSPGALKSTFGNSGLEPKPNESGNLGCVFENRVEGKKVHVRIIDMRLKSLAELLDSVPPDTDPSSTRVDLSDVDLSADEYSVLLPQLKAGAVQVSSNSKLVVDGIAASIESANT